MGCGASNQRGVTVEDQQFAGVNPGASPNGSAPPVDARETEILFRQLQLARQAEQQLAEETSEPQNPLGAYKKRAGKSVVSSDASTQR
eukprot:890205-Pyramimonas_sp.AAC.1